MLVHVALLPEVFDEAPETPEGREWYYPAALALLHDLTDNCVISVDANGLIRGGIFAAVQRWPPKYADPGLLLLGRLESHNRFASHGNPEAATCGHPHCQTVSALAAARSPFAVLASKAQRECLAASGLKHPLVTLPLYGASRLARYRRSKLLWVLNDGEIGQGEFERRAWTPLFSDAKHVKVFDKWIGSAQPITPRARVAGTISTMREGYERTLRWMVASFGAVPQRKATHSFEIITVLPNDVTANLRAIRDELSRFETELSASVLCTVRITVKRESDRVRMPHARFLISDQIALLIERGFDLLWDDVKMRRAGLDPSSAERRIRDATIAVCPEPARVENLFRLLPDW